MKMNTKNCTRCKEQKNISDFIKKCGRCKPCRTIHRKEYREKNKEHCKIKDAKHYQQHREKIRIQQNEYYKKNKKTIQNQRKKKREENPEQHRKKQRDYYRKNLDRRLGLVYRSRVRREIFSGKKYLQYLGCSIKHLKAWFEFNFSLDGFSWETYGKKWEIDHVTPCCKFDLKQEDNVYTCFNWKNTKPVLASFNKAKNGKIYNWQKIEQEIRIKLFEKEKSEQIMTTAH